MNQSTNNTLNTPNTNWHDYNDADDQVSYELIPKGTLAKVVLKIKPGGFDHVGCGWTGGWATQSDKTGAVYLNGEFTIMSGKYAKYKVWSLIGLYSPKNAQWAQMGRSFIKGILCSAFNVSPKDNSPKAQQARQIHDFGDLDSVVFLARIDTEKQSDDTYKNVIKTAITPDHKEYVIYMNENAQVPSASPTHPTTTDTPPWAQ